MRTSASSLPLPTASDGCPGPRRRRNDGFTLIELLVVIAIIAILVGILLPSLGAARERGRVMVCQSNVRQLATAAVLYAQDFKETVWSVNEWLRLPDHTGTAPGHMYEYLSKGEQVLGCPKNRRSAQGVQAAAGPTFSAGNTFGVRSELDTDYTMVGNTGGVKLSTQTLVAFDTRPLRPTTAAYATLSAAPHMRVVGSIPLFVEESTRERNAQFRDGRWLLNDRLTSRHDGQASMSFLDTSVRLQRNGTGAPKTEWQEFYTGSVYWSARRGGWVQDPVVGEPKPFGWINSPVP